MATQAVILAAGPAQRLMPLTESRPKGMLIVGGQPLLQHMVRSLVKVGVKDIVVVVGHRGEKIQSFFKDGTDFGVRIQYVLQPHPTGTLAALKLALPSLDATAPLWFLPGHAYVTPELLKPLANATRTTLLVATAGDGHAQGVPSVRGDRLQGMHHEAPVVGSTRVTTNIAVLGPEILQALLAGALSDHAEFDLALGDWASKGSEVRLVAATDSWHVLIGPWDLLRLNEWVLDHDLEVTKPKPRNARGRVHIGANSTIAPTAVLIGPVTIGEGCTIEAHCVIGPYVAIRNATIVSARSEIRRSILNNNVLVDSAAVLRGCILDDGVRLGPRVVCTEEGAPDGARGCIVGRDAVVAAGSILPSGTIRGVESQGP